MKTPTASSATSSQREQTFLLSQVPRSPRSSGCSTPGLENPSASVHPKRFSTPSLTPKFLCAGKLNPRVNCVEPIGVLFFGLAFDGVVTFEVLYEPKARRLQSCTIASACA